MIFKNKFFLSLLVIFLCCIFTQVSTASVDDYTYETVKEIMERQQEINNFQTEANLEVVISKKQNSSFNFIYYYHEPDLVHLETRDFVLLPTEPLKSLQPSFFALENYHIEFKGQLEDSNYLIHLIPNEKDNYWINVWINMIKKRIEKAEVFFTIPKYEKEFSLKVQYKQIKGYSMPVMIKGSIAIPTKFSTEGKIKNYNEGIFDMKLTNYKINEGFSNKIMKKLKK